MFNSWATGAAIGENLDWGGGHVLAKLEHAWMQNASAIVPFTSNADTIEALTGQG